VRERRSHAFVAQQQLEPVDVDAVGLQRHHPDVGAAIAQVQQRAVVGGGLDHDGVAGVHEQLEQERVGLHRAVGDQHLVDANAVLLGDPLAQRHVADRHPVRRRARRIALERELGCLAQPLHVDDVQRRRPAGEGDRVGHARQDTRIRPAGGCATPARHRACSGR
jgi:hypothetical protein